MAATKENYPKAQTIGGLDEYVQSMQTYLAKVDRDRDNSPELCRSDIAAIRRQLGGMRLSPARSSQLISSSPKKHYKK